MFSLLQAQPQSRGRAPEEIKRILEENNRSYEKMIIQILALNASRMRQRPPPMPSVSTTREPVAEPTTTHTQPPEEPVAREEPFFHSLLITGVEYNFTPPIGSEVNSDFMFIATPGGVLVVENIPENEASKKLAEKIRDVGHDLLKLKNNPSYRISMLPPGQVVHKVKPNWYLRLGPNAREVLSKIDEQDTWIILGPSREVLENIHIYISPPGH